MKSLRLIPPVHRATHRIGLYLAAGQAEALSQGESHILALLATSSPMTIGELHKGLAHKRSTLTSILNRLVARGLIRRELGESDRRTFVVTLTAKGRRAAREVFQQLADLERAVAAHVSEADLLGFSRVVAAIETEAQTRGGRKPSHIRKEDWLAVLKECPVSMDDVPPRRREPARRRKL